jgi:RNA polymerase sigma-70 factor (ECF subfamily)
MINFQDLYESYGKKVYRFALWLSDNPLEAEDITSETFIRAWLHNKKIRTETLQAYLFTISRNIYLQQQRKKKQRGVLNDIHPDPAPGPDKQAESHFQLQEVQSILQTMPEIDRTAFILRIQHELPYSEIARVLELSETAAKVKIYRVRKKLIAACIDKEIYQP